MKRALCWLVVAQFLHQFILCSGRRFILMIDAGSSGSRIHALPYEPTTGQNALPIFYHDSAQNYKIKPGLSSFEDAPAKSKSTISKLIDWAKQIVPEREWGSTPVHLKATAGLRAIPRVRADLILDRCSEVIDASPFQFQRHWAHVITGVDEGVYAWITANYLNGFIPSPVTYAGLHSKICPPACTNNQPRHGNSQSGGGSSSPNRNKEAPFSSAIQPIGVLEMGGASLQITFMLKNKMEPPIDGLVAVPLELGSSEFTIYTYSFLGYGLESVQDKFLETHPSSDDHPCYPRGFVYREVHGAGDFDACLDAMEAVMPFDLEGLESVRFFALENFFHTKQFYGIDSSSSEQVLPSLREKAEGFCSSHWTDLKTKHPDSSAEDLSKYCFSAAYITRLLGGHESDDETAKDSGGTGDEEGRAGEEQAGDDDESKTNIEIKQDVSGVALDWAIGAAICEISHQPQLSSTAKKLSLQNQNMADIDIGLRPSNSLVSVPFFPPTSLYGLVWYSLFCVPLSTFLWYCRNRAQRRRNTHRDC